MRVLYATNVNDAWDQAKKLLNETGIKRQSRVGEVIEAPFPVTTVYANPTERVLFNSERNANPFFHLFESLWMLAGRNDLQWIEQFNSKISDFVGKDPTIHGAYGYRWRKAFDLDGGAEDDFADQLPKIIRMLKKNPDERRAVLTMWNPLWDLERPELKDVPCNLIVTFKIRNSKLDMIVFCRSNDVVMGCYGANVVHFSYLQEYMAAMIGVPIGTYYQVSDSWHGYTERWAEFGGYVAIPTCDLYHVSQKSNQNVEPYPLVQDPERFDEDLQEWFLRTDHTFSNSFFVSVAEPLWKAWIYYKRNDIKSAFRCINACEASDWRFACVSWLYRILNKRAVKENQKLD